MTVLACVKWEHFPRVRVQVKEQWRVVVGQSGIGATYRIKIVFRTGPTKTHIALHRIYKDELGCELPCGVVMCLVLFPAYCIRPFH